MRRAGKAGIAAVPAGSTAARCLLGALGFLLVHVASIALGQPPAPHPRAPGMGPSLPDLRVLAIELANEAEGERAWVQVLPDGAPFSLRAGDRWRDGEVSEVDAVRGTLEVRDYPPDPERKLLRPWNDYVQPTFGTISPALLEARSGECPRFVDRVEGERVVLRGADGRSELRLAIGEELCAGWFLVELRGPTEHAPEGQVVIGRGERRLLFRAAWP